MWSNTSSDYFKDSTIFTHSLSKYPIFIIFPGPRISFNTLCNLYPCGVKLLLKNGWEFDTVVGTNKNNFITPLEMVPVQNEITSNNIAPINFSEFYGTFQENDRYKSSLKVLPHITINCEQVDLIALVDSGCEISCVNESSFEELYKKIHNCMYFRLILLIYDQQWVRRVPRLNVKFGLILLYPLTRRIFHTLYL